MYGEEEMTGEMIAMYDISDGGASKRTGKSEDIHTDVVAEVCAGENANAEVLLHLSDDLDRMVNGEMCLLRLSLALELTKLFD